MCQIWAKKTAPRACTASTMGFHACTCSSVQSPGTWVPARGLRHGAGLGDEEAARRRALAVVERHVRRLRHVAVRPPRHRRQHHPERQVEGAHLVRCQERRRSSRGRLHICLLTASVVHICLSLTACVVCFLPVCVFKGS